MTTLYLVWECGRSTSSGQPLLLGIFSTKEAAKVVVAGGDRKITVATLDELLTP